MAWTDLSFPFGSTLTSAQMTNLFSNFQALADNDSGAPKLPLSVISTGNAITAVSSIDITWDETAYWAVLLLMENATPSSDGICYGRLGYNNGANIITAAEYDGGATAWILGGGATESTGPGVNITLFVVGGGVDQGSAAWDLSPNENIGSGGTPSTTASFHTLSADGTSAIDTIRIYFTSNFQATGTWSLLGIPRYA